MGSKAWQWAVLVLSLVGVGIAIYLTAVHYENAPLICSSQGLVDCARVISSPYSVVPGTSIPITLPGLAWCATGVALAVIGLRVTTELRWLRIVEFAWTLVGMLTVLYLVYVEIVRLHTICAWCTGLHAIILALFLITLLQLQQQGRGFEPEAEAEESTVTTKAP